MEGSGNPTEEQDRNKRINQLLLEGRPRTRSVTRLLDNQVFGSVLNQIDTGIVRPFNWTPASFFDIGPDFFRGRRSTELVCQQSIFNTNNQSSSFAQKVDRLSMMSSGEVTNQALGNGGTAGISGSGSGVENQQNNTSQNADNRNTEGNGEGNVQNQPVAEGGVNAQLALMMQAFSQQSQLLLECVGEMRTLRTEVGVLNQRVSDVEGSTRQATLPAPGNTSTPRSNINTEHQNRENRGDGSSDQQDQRDNNPQAARTPNGQSLDINFRHKRKNVDLDKWHVKFDGTGKSMTVESFLFRIEKLRDQYDITYDQLFTDFHALLSGNAVKWYWQLLEDHEDDIEFGYLELKEELLSHYRTLDSDREITREIMERKQQPAESFDDFYAEIHNLTFRLRKKYQSQNWWA